MALYQCEGCDSRFLLDVYSACPMCKKAPEVSAVQRPVETPIARIEVPAVGLYAAKQARERGGRGSSVVPLIAGLAIGAAAVFGYMALNSPNGSPNVVNIPIQDNGFEENMNVYNEDDSYEEPSGHYEQQCNDVLKTRPRTYDEMVAGVQAPSEWVTECRDVWVEE